MSNAGSSGDPIHLSLVHLTSHTGNTDIGFDETGVIFDQIAFVISKYVLPMLVACGVVNNTLIIIVMSQSKYRKIVSCFYLRSLAIFDIVTIIFFVQVHVFGVMTTGAAAFGDVFCIEVFILAYFSTNASNWTTVLMTYTRFIAVVFPLKVGLWCTQKAARIYMAVMILFFASASSVQCILWVKSGGSHPAYYCYMTLSVEHANIYNRVHSVLAYVAPSLLISMFNLGIFIKLRMRTVDDVEVKAHSSKEEQMTMTMVMVASLVFICLIFPYILIVFSLDYGYLDSDLKTPYERKLRTFYNYAAFLIYFFNVIVNFYLYFVCCKKFRHDLFSMVSCFRKN
jgi:hypothetical protein